MEKKRVLPITIIALILVHSIALRLDDVCDPSTFSSPFDNYTSIFCPQSTEIETPLRLQFDRPLPAFIRGLRYVVNSFAKFRIGDGENAEEFTYYMDGYQKAAILDFHDNGDAVFSTRFINTVYYTKAIEAGHPIAGCIFNVTTPKRKSDYIPLENFRACNLGNCDQAPVITFLLPDNTTMVSTTDKSDWLQIDSDLSTPGSIEWQDDIIGFNSPAASHALIHSPTGDRIGVALDSNTPKLNVAKVFRLSASAPTTRQLIGSVDLAVTGVLYMHSFGLSHSYAVVVEHPVSMDGPTLMSPKPLLDAFRLDPQGTTKFHVMRLTDAGRGKPAGSYVTLDADHAFMLMHVGNTYEALNNRGEEVLHMDVEMYKIEDGVDDPFGTLGFSNIFDEDFVPNTGNVYRRYILNLATGDVSHKDLLVPKVAEGSRPYGFPVVNPFYAGQKNCYTYLSKLVGRVHQHSIIKYDHCRDRVAGEWNAGETLLFPTELVFVADPNAEFGNQNEDMGVLFGFVYDAATLKSVATFVDAKTMKTLTTAEVPFRIPWPVHGQVFPIPIPM